MAAARGVLTVGSRWDDILRLLTEVEAQAPPVACAGCGARPTNTLHTWEQTGPTTLELRAAVPGWAVVDARQFCPACYRSAAVVWDRR